MIYNENVRVVSNSLIASNTYETTLESISISKEVKPGQFVNILPSSDFPMLMRRPMSISGVSDNTFNIIYKAVGEGTNLMSNWDVGDVIDMIGPLGNSWDNYLDKKPVLIGGGVGIAPILFFHTFLNTNNISHSLIMGARTQEEHFMTHNPEEGVYLTTDDGSMGIKGNISDALEQAYQSESESDCKFFVCGPPLMMEFLRKHSIQKDIECDIALETVMACGIGICQGCAMELCEDESKIKSTYRERFGLVCMDGPIFKSKDIKTCLI